ncbi:UNVERIFIED_CONTAM: putative pectinesterase/pectinesterase inhibitor 58 [Sesamum angustifolium]|uniref:Pectinesterase n=1 Tax=Sesamum angustifolium TaxID=2727405 RepID=A0AAW2LWR1_9LAMI
MEAGSSTRFSAAIATVPLKNDQTFVIHVKAVSSDDFIAKDIGFENTAGAEGHQAVALRASGDRAVFYNVHIDGYQDTLYAHTYRQYYRDCTISGTIDFIFGDALAIFQNCRLVIRKPLPNQACMITAQGRVDRRSVALLLSRMATSQLSRRCSRLRHPTSFTLADHGSNSPRPLSCNPTLAGSLHPRAGHRGAELLL